MTTKKKIILTTLALSLILIEYIFHSSISRLIESEVRSAIKQQNISVSFDSADYGYLPPRILLKTLSFKNKTVLLSASEISLSIQILPLIKGLLRPNKLTINKANFSITISTKKKNTTSSFSLEDLKLEPILKTLPFEKVQVLDSKAILFLGKNVINLNIQEANVQKLYKKLQLELSSLIKVRTPNLKDKFHLNTKLRWQEDSYFLNFFTLQKENSLVQLSGSLKKEIFNDFQLKTKNLYQDINELRVKLNLDLSEFNDVLILLTEKTIHPKASVRTFSGRVQASGYYYNSQKTNDKSILTFQADNIKTPFVSLESFSAKGELSDKDFYSESIKLKLSNKSFVSFTPFKIRKKNDSFLLSTNIKSKHMHVEDILTSLNLNVDMISIPVSLNAHCGGVILKKINLKCQGKGDLKKLNIFAPGKRDRKIVSINKISTSFNGLVTGSNFSFSADATYIDPQSSLVSSGTASGNVDYLKGFDVTFKSDPIKLTLINEISGQKFKGLSSLSGSTKGSSKWGEVSVDLVNQDFQFNDLFLGNNTASVKYKFPLLTIENIKGEILEGSNQYRGNISLNVDESDLILDLKGDNTSDSGVRALFLDIFKLPEDIKFNSSFSFFASNGLDLNKMDLDLKVFFNNFDLFGEHFTQGNVHIKGPNGNWTVANGVFKKDTSSFKAQGRLEGLKALDVQLTSTDFKIQDSDFLKTIGVQLTGPASITLSAKGPIEGPKATGVIRLSNTYGSRQSNLGDSLLEYRLYEDSFYFKGNAFNKSLSGEGFYPISEKGKLSFKGEFKKLNVLNFVDFNSQNAHDTRLLLWSKADFSIDDISKDSPTGELSETHMELISEGQSLASLQQTQGFSFSKPIEFALKQSTNKGIVSLDLSKKGFSIFNFNGGLQLNILKPFIPTCEYISGQLTADDIQIASSHKGYKASGSGSIKKASFKTDAFPYSFNKISADLKLSKNLIHVKNIKSSLVNTTVYGGGSLTLVPQNSSLDFNLHYKNLNIEFPSKISTQTSGAFRLTGDQIPLLLKGELVVHKGLFAQDIITSESSEIVTPNKLLPKKILKKSTPPASLDVKVQIKNKMEIRTNEALGYAYGLLQARGNPADPLLKGSIQLKPGMKVSLHDKKFNLKEGRLIYKNALASNPVIFIDALSRIKDNNDPAAKDYSIRLLIKGSADKPNIKFSSLPSLEENQIISLLTIGTISTQRLGQEITAAEQAAYSGLQFGSYLMQKNQALKDLQKQTGTQIGLSSSVNAGGVNPKVFVKKSWNPRSSSTLSQTFGNQKNLSFTTEYKLNKKTSTVLGIQNNQTDDASQLVNRRVQQGVIFNLGLQYKFEFD